VRLSNLSSKDSDIGDLISGIANIARFRGMDSAGGNRRLYSGSARRIQSGGIGK